MKISKLNAIVTKLFYNHCWVPVTQIVRDASFHLFWRRERSWVWLRVLNTLPFRRFSAYPYPDSLVGSMEQFLPTSKDCGIAWELADLCFPYASSRLTEKKSQLARLLQEPTGFCDGQNSMNNNGDTQSRAASQRIQSNHPEILLRHSPFSCHKLLWLPLCFHII